MNNKDFCYCYGVSGLALDGEWEGPTNYCLAGCECPPDEPNVPILYPDELVQLCCVTTTPVPGTTGRPSGCGNCVYVADNPTCDDQTACRYQYDAVNKIYTLVKNGPCGANCGASGLCLNWVAAYYQFPGSFPANPANGELVDLPCILDVGPYEWALSAIDYCHDYLPTVFPPVRLPGCDCPGVPPTPPGNAGQHLQRACLTTTTPAPQGCGTCNWTAMDVLGEVKWVHQGGFGEPCGPLDANGVPSACPGIELDVEPCCGWLCLNGIGWRLVNNAVCAPDLEGDGSCKCRKPDDALFGDSAIPCNADTNGDEVNTRCCVECACPYPDAPPVLETSTQTPCTRRLPPICKPQECAGDGGGGGGGGSCGTCGWTWAVPGAWTQTDYCPTVEGAICGCQQPAFAGSTFGQTATTDCSVSFAFSFEEKFSKLGRAPHIHLNLDDIKNKLAKPQIITEEINMPIQVDVVGEMSQEIKNREISDFISKAISEIPFVKIQTEENNILRVQDKNNAVKPDVGEIFGE